VTLSRWKFSISETARIERDVVNGDWYRWFNSDEITKIYIMGSIQIV